MKNEAVLGAGESRLLMLESRGLWIACLVGLLVPPFPAFHILPLLLVWAMAVGLVVAHVRGGHPGCDSSPWEWAEPF